MFDFLVDLTLLFVFAAIVIHSIMWIRGPSSILPEKMDEDYNDWLDDEEKPHEHVWGKWEIIERGALLENKVPVGRYNYQQRTCKECGYTEEIKNEILR